MSAPDVYLLQFYRQGPGDVGIDDIALFSDQDFESVAQKALLGYFNNCNIAPHQRPHHARVTTHDGFKVILTLMATGPTTVEKV
ncbi:hypothetical protein V5G24_01965 [Xanthobacter sp. VTT E-85241]|uniref:hypothetical protein n=1 Tax=Roseixanthobacter finlandensis TaxID=3119922 RepID=UPI00372BD2B2